MLLNITVWGKLHGNDDIKLTDHGVTWVDNDYG